MVTPVDCKTPDNMLSHWVQKMDIDAIVDAMARAVEPECERLAELAVEETGYGNVADKRVKNLFNALSVADYLRDKKQDDDHGSPGFQVLGQFLGDTHQRRGTSLSVAKCCMKLASGQ